MRTCTNCRYELRPQHTTCPMCGWEAAAAKRGGRGIVVVMLVLVVVALGVGLSVAAKGPSSRQAATRTVASPKAPASCPAKPVSSPVPKKSYPEAPAEQLDATKRYTLVFETSCGDIAVELDVARAPKTTSSVAFLVRDGFYDGLVFHRVVPGVVVQGGDPQGTGAGGPGYTVVEAPPEGLRYEPGIVAMFKRGDEPQGASGSQFFIVSGPGAVQPGKELPADYALVGTVSKGMDVVQAIERTQGPNVSIVKARIVES